MREIFQILLYIIQSVWLVFLLIFLITIIYIFDDPSIFYVGWEIDPWGSYGPIVVLMVIMFLSQLMMNFLGGKLFRWYLLGTTVLLGGILFNLPNPIMDGENHIIIPNHLQTIYQIFILSSLILFLWTTKSKKYPLFKK